MCFICLPTLRHELVLPSHTRALARLAKRRHGWHGMAWRGMVWYGLAGRLGAGLLNPGYSTFGNYSNLTQEFWPPFW